MMHQVLRLKHRIGVVGILSLLSAGFWPLFYFTGYDLLLVTDTLILLPSASLVCFRLIRFILRRFLWNLRNRLLLVYGLVGMLPLLLLLALFGIVGWCATSEVAIYLVNSALNNDLKVIHTAAETLQSASVKHAEDGAPEIVALCNRVVPDTGVCIISGTERYQYRSYTGCPDDSRAWGTAHGLLFDGGQFYAWAHEVSTGRQTTVVAPLSKNFMANLVPGLGRIYLFAPEHYNAGAANNSRQSYQVENAAAKPRTRWFDIPIVYASTRPHFELDKPARTETTIMMVRSSIPSVWHTLFSRPDALRAFLIHAIIIIGTSLFAAEVVALLIGISLSRRVLRTLNQLYEGTRQVSGGNLTIRIPAASSDQLGEVASSFNRMTSDLQRLIAVEKEEQRLKGELEVAREVQRELYPKESPPQGCGLEVTFRWAPAHVVSGDYYDFRLICGKTLAFAVGDVAGKGLPAALLMAALHASVRAQLMSRSRLRREGMPQADGSISTAEVVSDINDQLYFDTSAEKYATLFLAIFDPGSHRITYTNAGHPSPFLISGGRLDRLDSNGTVVGMFRGIRFSESIISMRAGDLLMCYTDGATEAENAFGEMFGEQRLIDLVTEHLQQPNNEILDAILEGVRRWTAKPELSDDVTVGLMRCVS